MGKGGEQPVRDQAAGKKGLKPFKLDHMPTEELRKWAKAYGVNSEKNREELLHLMNGFADGIMDKNRPSNPPIAPPAFTLKDLKDAIPKHCFERHLSTSLGYLAVDLLKAFLLGYAATYISQASAYGLPQWARFVLWPMYWWAQGCTLMGVWVLSHECGHQSFSESEFANNLVGTIFHSALFVPYHPWRITHAKHHNNTGSCDNDEVFSPFTRSDWGQEMLRETPLANFWGIFVMFTVGWIPGYLVMNITGPRKYRGKNANHFSPTAVFFTKEEYWLVVQSVTMVYLALACLGYAIFVFGFSTVFAYYLVPYLIVNMFLVLLTFLQHTDVYMPHFRGAEWNWFRGAICTIDRSYGFFWDRATHHITDTHVCHHLFSKMPFYHAIEATQHIKRIMGPYYKYDPTPIPQAVYRAYHCCQFIEDTGDIEFYKNVK